jgi:hypothetical protein
VVAVDNADATAFGLSRLDAAVSSVAAAVWAVGTRTLTSFGTLVADIWANATRTLSSFGTLVADVWGYDIALSGANTAGAKANATWTNNAALRLMGMQTVTHSENPTAYTIQAWNSTNQVTLDGSVASSVDDAYTGATLAMAGANYEPFAVRRITAYDGTTKVATLDSNLPSDPTGKYYGIFATVINPDASSLTAADVWSYGTRTLTSFGTLVADIWAYTSRTLTQTAASIVAALTGSQISIRRGDLFSVSLTGLGNISARTALYFTIKSNLDTQDADALVQISESGGLLYLNGATTTTSNGTLTVTDATAGNITITIKAAATASLAARRGAYYDVQMVTASGVSTLTESSANILADVTRRTS